MKACRAKYVTDDGTNNTPITKLKVQCPKCHEWSEGLRFASYKILFDTDIAIPTFYCPVCEKRFGGYLNNVEIEKVDDSDDFFKGVYLPKLKWEKE